MPRKRTDQKKKEQISFKVDEETFAETTAGLKREEISLADFSRKLHRIALTLYGKLGNFRDMRALVDKVDGEPRKDTVEGRKNMRVG